MVAYKESRGEVKLVGLVCPLECQVKVAVVLYEEEQELVSGITALQRCPNPQCRLTQVELTKVMLNQKGTYSVALVCNACEENFAVEVSAEALAAFIHNVERDKMEKELRNFSIALRQNIIGPDDFRK